MTTLSIINLAESTRALLRMESVSQGRSMEQEALAISGSTLPQAQESPCDPELETAKSQQERAEFEARALRPGRRQIWWATCRRERRQSEKMTTA